MRKMSEKNNKLYWVRTLKNFLVNKKSFSKINTQFFITEQKNKTNKNNPLMKKSEDAGSGIKKSQDAGSGMISINDLRYLS